MHYTTKSILVIACSVMSMSLIAKTSVTSTVEHRCFGIQETSGCSSLPQSVSPQNCKKHFQTENGVSSQCSAGKTKTNYRKPTPCEAGPTCIYSSSAQSTAKQSHQHKKNHAH